MKLSGLSLLGVVVGVAGASFAVAQMTAPATPALYTSDQATQGAALYATKCALCHGAKLEGDAGPALSGTGFAQVAAGQQLTGKSLYDVLSSSMPSTAPGSLKQEEYEALEALILQANGFPAGSTPLRKDSPELAQTALSHKASAGAAATTHPASSGIYTSAQADHGKALYADNCLSCHGGDLGGEEGLPALAGQEFLSKWTGQSVGAIFNVIDKTMPPGNGGAMGPSGDADILAYILSANHYPAGSSSLPSDPQGLSAITLDKAP